MKKILIVDDDAINRKLVAIFIKKIGEFELIEAENGLEALNIIKSTNIDFVFLDIQMPVMDGIDLLKILQDDEKFKNIPVVVLTTDDTRKNEIATFNVAGVLIKPINQPDLQKLMEEFL